MHMNVARAFEEPIVIILSWMILIIGILGAAHLIGAKMPTDGIAGGAGDLFRNA
jgi:hypothetical protein